MLLGNRREHSSRQSRTQSIERAECDISSLQGMPVLSLPANTTGRFAGEIHREFRKPGGISNHLYGCIARQIGWMEFAERSGLLGSVRAWER